MKVTPAMARKMTPMQALNFIYASSLGPKPIAVAVSFALSNWKRYT